MFLWVALVSSLENKYNILSFFTFLFRDQNSKDLIWDTAFYSVDIVSIQNGVVESRNGHFGRIRLAEHAHVAQEHVVIAYDVDRLAESTQHAALYHTLDRSVEK